MAAPTNDRLVRRGQPGQLPVGTPRDDARTGTGGGQQRRRSRNLPFSEMTLLREVPVMQLRVCGLRLLHRTDDRVQVLAVMRQSGAASPWIPPPVDFVVAGERETTEFPGAGLIPE